VRYRHLRRTVIAVLASTAFLLLFGLLVRAALEAEPTRRLAVRWIEQVATGYGAELEIGDLHWSVLPPGLRLSRVTFQSGGVAGEADALQVNLGRIWLTRRTVELGTVAAQGVRLSLNGLPRPAGDGGGGLKIRVRQLALDDLHFEGVDLPGKLGLGLEGLRAGWSTDSGHSRGFADVARAQLRIKNKDPVDFGFHSRFELSENALELPTYRLEGEGFEFLGRGRVVPGNARFEADGAIDVDWLDGFLRTHGLLDGNAEVSVVVDTQAEALVAADVRAPRLVAAGFPVTDAAGRIALVGRSLRATLDRARFHGGFIRGSYVLGNLGGSYPHSVHLEGDGISLAGILRNLNVESAGLAATFNLAADGDWNGSSFGAGRGHADLRFRGASPGVPVSGDLDIDLTGEGFLRFDADNLELGTSLARWQGALTLGSWEPSWSIIANPAVFSEIGPMVNAWVGSTVLPETLAGQGQLQVTLSGAFSDLVVNARVDAEPLTLAPVTIDRLVAEATIDRSTLRLASARYQISDGFGEVDGDIFWGEEAGDRQLDLKIRGRQIPLRSAAGWVGLEPWVDDGLFSFSGTLGGLIANPKGSWIASLENLALAGLDLGGATTTIELDDRRFTCHDLRCDHGPGGQLWWDVSGGVVGGALTWSQMPTAAVSDQIASLAGDAADVRLDFRMPFGERPTVELEAVSENARLEMRAESDVVDITAQIGGTVEAQASLARLEGGALHGDGTVELLSAQELLTLLAPDSGVPLAGKATAAFTVDWGDEPLPRLEGVLESIDLALDKQPIGLVESARFSISQEGFVVPGLRLRVHDDEVFVRWAIDPDGALRGNLSGTMDALLLRFLIPDWEPAGRATGIIELLGTLDAPSFEGIAEVHKVSFRLPDTRNIVSQVDGTVLLSSGDVGLDGMDFRFMGGRGRCSGRIRQRDDTIVLALNGTAEGVRFEVLPDLDARLSGSWRLSGPIDDLLLAGDITVDHMSLTTKEDVATLLIRWLGASKAFSTDDGGLSLALRVEADETIELRNPFVRLTGSASLEVTGTSNQPGLVGQVEVQDGGEATLLGNRYEIERGSLSFSNPNAIEPFFDLQAATWIQEFQITAQISGTLDRFVSTAVSTPPLSAPEIYSLLGVGYRGTGLGASAMGLGLASSILSSELTSALSRRAQLVLPIDQVRVDPFAADSTGNPTARVSVIKQLTPEWTVILQSTLQGEREQIVVSRWYIAPGLFLEAAQHEDGSYSLDIKMRRPY
jgi:hypothetical protein